MRFSRPTSTLAKWVLAVMVAVGRGVTAQAQFVAEPIPGGAMLYSAESSFAAGDVDGDGDIDLVWNEEDLEVGPVLLINDGLGGFRRYENRFPGGYFPDPQGVLLADFDGDGDLDVVTLGDFATNISIDGWQTVRVRYSLALTGGAIGDTVKFLFSSTLGVGL